MRNFVRKLREQRSLTQKELGDRVGVSRQAINAIETGKCDPSIWLAHDLASFFGVLIEGLFVFDGRTKDEAYSEASGGERCWHC